MALFSLCFVPLLFFSAYSHYEYKYSFKPPILEHGQKVPFFTITGNAIPDNTRIRVAPSIQDQKGLVQSKFQTTFKWWEVLVNFQILSPHRIGADGMAFWYTNSPGSVGPVFGRSDRWTGLALILDSYDNDHKKNNPMIAGFLNNATYEYDHRNDGGNRSIGKCQVDFRNSHFPSQLRIQYYKNKLTVWYLHGYGEAKVSPVLSKPLLNENEDSSNVGIICFQATNVYLPERGYFGLSAMTGGFGDDHDVYSMSTFSITESKDTRSSTVPVQDANQQREYDQMLKEFEKEQKMFLEKGGDVPGLSSEYKQPDYEDDPYNRNLHAIYVTNVQFAQQLDSLGKMVAELRLMVQKVALDANNNNQPNNHLNEIRQFMKKTVENMDLLARNNQEIQLVQSYLRQLKSDLHYLADQINTGHRICSKSVTITTLGIAMIIQLVLFVAFISIKFVPRGQARNYF